MGLCVRDVYFAEAKSLVKENKIIKADIEFHYDIQYFSIALRHLDNKISFFCDKKSYKINYFNDVNTALHVLDKMGIKKYNIKIDNPFENKQAIKIKDFFVDAYSAFSKKNFVTLAVIEAQLSSIVKKNKLNFTTEIKVELDAGSTEGIMLVVRIIFESGFFAYTRQSKIESYWLYGGSEPSREIVVAWLDSDVIPCYEREALHDSLAA